jgi:hypothetical protein
MALLEVKPLCLIAYVDETGHEEFADADRPIFGYAGCMVMAANAQTVLVEPWARSAIEIIRNCCRPDGKLLLKFD